jgi:hypothetical protein
MNKLIVINHTSNTFSANPYVRNSRAEFKTLIEAVRCTGTPVVFMDCKGRQFVIEENKG